MELADKLKELSDLEGDIWLTLESESNELPQNPNIKRLNKNCYVVNFSEVQKDKEQTMGAEYYDFKAQHKLIIEALEQADTIRLLSCINYMIDSGYVNVKRRHTKLHPEVIEQLKGLIG